LVDNLEKYISEHGNADEVIRFKNGETIVVDEEVPKFKGMRKRKPQKELHVDGDMIAVKGVIARHYNLFYVGGGAYSTTMLTLNPKDRRCSWAHYAKYLADFGSLVYDLPSTTFLEEIVQAYPKVLTAMVPSTKYPDALDEHIRYIFQNDVFDEFSFPRIEIAWFITNHSLHFSANYPNADHNGVKYMSLLNDLPKLSRALALIAGHFAEEHANRKGFTTVSEEEMKDNFQI
jgi:hypothetical protein